MATKPPPPSPAVSVVPPPIPPVVYPSAKAETQEEALKQILKYLSGTRVLPKMRGSEPIQMAKPDKPSIIRPKAHGMFPTSGSLYLPKQLPEGQTPLAPQIRAHLEKKPPINEPEEVIEEDLEIKDPKER